MVVKLIVVWFLAVVAFFVLWALLVKVVKHISEKKKGQEETESESKPSQSES